MELIDLLRQMERRPQLFLGTDDIFALRHFLSGYIMAEKEHDPAYHDWLFSGFPSYLSQLYQDDRDLDWATLIRLHEPDGDSVAAFFRLAHRYYEILQQR